MRKIISLLLKLVIALFALTGTVLCMNAGTDTFMGGTTVLLYFTIQSNLALAIVAGVGAYFLLRKGPVPAVWYVIKYVATLAITVTGGVFCFVLAPTMGSAAWGAANVFTHVIVPVASIADFFVSGIDADIPMKKIPYVTIPPLAYLAFASIGYVANWQFAPGINYPYFFLNWGSPAGAFGFSSELPFMGCVWWILLLLVLILAFGWLYLVILGAIKRRFFKN